MACCGYLISNQNVLIYTTHIKKVIAKLYSFALRRKITEKQYQVRNFAEVRNFAWQECRSGLRPEFLLYAEAGAGVNILGSSRSRSQH